MIATLLRHHVTRTIVGALLVLLVVLAGLALGTGRWHLALAFVIADLAVLTLDEIALAVTTKE